MRGFFILLEALHEENQKFAVFGPMLICFPRLPMNNLPCTVKVGRKTPIVDWKVEILLMENIF